jgi:predicted TPR repeat methyltransferase
MLLQPTDSRKAPLQIGPTREPAALATLKRYDYSGTVLDLACGTGGIGMLIHAAGHEARISGIDLSPLSLQTSQVRAHYTPPLVAGPLQEEIMRFPTPVDHIVCFGALHFLTATEFIATLARMFMLARKSVAFDVDDVSEEYISKIVARFGEGLRNHNNLLALRRFDIPSGWRKVVEEEGSLFFSPSVQSDVRGLMLRFEKD